MYSENIDAVIGLIQHHDPDIVFLQELTKDYNPTCPDTGKYVADKLGYHHHYSYGMMRLPDGAAAMMGMGIFCKYPLSSRQKIILQEGVVDGSGAVLTDERFFLQAAVQVNNKLIGGGTTHLPFHPRFQTTPQKEQMINAIIRSTDQYENYLFGADLNTTPYTKAARHFRSGGFKNAGPALRYPSWTTKPFSIGEFHYSALQWRLDCLLVKGDLKSKAGKVIKTELSDHLPLVATLDT